LGRIDPVISQVPGGVALDVRVVPRSGRAGITGTRDGVLLVRLSAAPVEGAANAELIRILADVFRLPRRAITIVAGERARRKRVVITGVALQEASAKLHDYL
jgi:uncharacterized protein (TIGR00251 family)